jgi:hypothetical protein
MVADPRFLIERAQARAEWLLEAWGDDAEVRDDARLLLALAAALAASANE